MTHNGHILRATKHTGETTGGMAQKMVYTGQKLSVVALKLDLLQVFVFVSISNQNSLNLNWKLTGVHYTTSNLEYGG